MVRPNETRQYVHDPRRYQSRLRLRNGVQEVSVWQEPRAERGFFFAGRSARRPERALVAPIKRTKQASKRRRLKRTICEIKGGLRRAQGANGAWPTLATYSRGEQLWCYRNTLKFFMQRHITGRIAWSHPKYQRIWGLIHDHR